MSPEGLSLLAFKSAISGDPSSTLESWNEDDADPCRWPGVTCSNISGDSTSPRVVGVAISSKNLTGYIPSELGSLVYLRRLNLHGNKLSGDIPSQLFNASSLHSIFLYDNNLSGIIPPSICNLPHLQNLDLSGNSLTGKIPVELHRCRQLQRILVARNNLIGDIPAGVWPDLQGLLQLDLSSNAFTGEIPAELGSLSSLGGTLNLSHNRLSGEIPSSLGRLPAAVSLDLRFNNLSGEIPQSGSLANQGPTAFLNNPGLCGFPLQNPCTPPAPSAPGGRKLPSPAYESSPEKKGLKPNMIVLITVADAAAVAVIGLVLVYAYWKLKDSGGKGCSCTGTKKLGGRKHDHLPCTCFGGGGGGASEDGDDEDEEREEDITKGSSTSNYNEDKLVALDKGFSFELDELLRASAYVLGKSGRGIVYKVVLGSGVPVAVRRLGGGGVGGGEQKYKEFAAEAQAIGRVRHQNVVRLRAYYWAQDEKLLITDFISGCNIATALRGRSGQPSLSWSIRLKIAKGSARGLAHIHECSPRKYVHGDIKPSNILLDSDYNPYISDFGLHRLINIAGADVSTSGGGYLGGAIPSAAAAPPTDRLYSYRAPEARTLSTTAKPTQKWDVYSFGVVLLELLTGKSPEFTSPGSSSTSAAATAASPASGGVAELVRWVRKGFEDARPLAELVDGTLLRQVQAKNEVIAVFHIALACTDTDPEARPRMKAVVDNLDRVGGA